MTAASIEIDDSPIRSTDRVGDAFLTGLVMMLVLNVGQRALGLLRNIGFCHFLSESDLGLWALANSFFMIGAPIAVLGLPGSLGKFVEHYRLQNCLRPYLIRLTLASSLGVLLFCSLLLTFPDHASSILYGQPLGFSVIAWTAISLVFLILFNTTAELVMSLRLVRLGSLMHLINTLVFTSLGICGIAWTGQWVILLPAFSLACLSAIIPGLWGAWRATVPELTSCGWLPAKRMWGRVVPFAAALWFSNLMSNLFDLSDRYMLLHLCDMGAAEGQAMVGQFYCARILPNLLLSIGMMLGGIVLPYLSADWERQRFDRISSSVNSLLVVLSVGFTVISLVAIALAPVLFDWFFEDRYRQAAEILTLGMMLACWSGLSTVAAAYLLCAEKGTQNAGLLGLSLIVNIVLNWPLILGMGLYGAALATCISNAFLLGLVLWRSHREGCTIRWSTVLFCSLPLGLSLGVPAASAIILGLTVLCGRTNWLLGDSDRQAIDAAVLPYLMKFKVPLRSLWPTSAGPG